MVLSDKVRDLLVREIGVMDYPPPREFRDAESNGNYYYHGVKNPQADAVRYLFEALGDRLLMDYVSAKVEEHDFISYQVDSVFQERGYSIDILTNNKGYVLRLTEMGLQTRVFGLLGEEDGPTIPWNADPSESSQVYDLAGVLVQLASNKRVASNGPRVQRSWHEVLTDTVGKISSHREKEHYQHGLAGMAAGIAGFLGANPSLVRQVPFLKPKPIDATFLDCQLYSSILYQHL